MSNPKSYSLKPIETQLLKVITEQQGALLSNVLSFIALERLALPVTQHTRFELSADMDNVTISDDTPEEDTGVIESPKKGAK